MPGMIDTHTHDVPHGALALFLTGPKLPCCEQVGRLPMEPSSTLHWRLQAHHHEHRTGIEG